MSFRTRVSVLSTVLVVLIVTFVLGTFFSPQARRDRAANRPVVGEFAPAEIGTIRFLPATADEADAAGDDSAATGSDESSGAADDSASADAGVILRRRSEDSWAVRIDGSLFPARRSRVTGFLDALADLRTVRSVTDNSEFYGDFEIGDGAADRLILERPDGSALEQLYFGKSATQANRVYVRSGDDPTVYMTQDSVSFYLREEGEYWAELAALPRSLTGASVQRISIDADIAVGEPQDRTDATGGTAEGATGLERRVADFTVFRGPNGNWRFDESFSLPDDGTMDQEAVDRWASNIVDLEAAAYADQELGGGETGLDNPSLTVSVATDTGREYTLNVGARPAPDADRFYLRGAGPDVLSRDDGRPYLFEASIYSVRRLFRAPDDLYAVSDDRGDASESQE